MTKTTITVNGMSCAHCEARVNKAIDAIDGVSSSKASSKKSEVTVKFDEARTSLDAIKAVITETGYEVN